MQESMETFAGTASRWAQRVVCFVCVQHVGFKLWSFDVAAAFAKGMTFSELSKLTGTELRSVQFDLRGEDIRLLRQIPGFENFDPIRESLDMVKPIYGLKDAPRAWRLELDQLLREFGLTPLFSDAQLYIKVVLEKGARRITMFLSTHVDDLKGCSTESEAAAFVTFMEKSIGGMTQEWGKFTHTCIEHEQLADGSIYQHQSSYAAQLRPIDISQLKGKPDEEIVSETMKSFLFELAWRRCLDVPYAR